MAYVTDAPPLTLRAPRRRAFRLRPEVMRFFWVVFGLALFVGAPFIPNIFA